jgi:phosphoglycolate phosphatase
MMGTRWAGLQAVLFDLDGTLLDSAPDLGAAADEMRQDRGLPSLPLDAYRAHAGSGARGMLKVALEVTPEHDEFEALREEYLARYEARLLATTRPFDGVEELVARLSHLGLPWGVVTNKASRFTVPLTRSIPFFAQARAVVCGDTTPHTKPHPAPLLEAARQMGLSPAACVYVGDDHRDVLAGRAAGMRTVAAGYGYLGPGAVVSAWGADAEISSPLQVLKLLELP